MSLNKSALPRTSLVLVAALAGACEVSLGPAVPEPEEPAQPRVRKLYAPGAEPGGDPAQGRAVEARSAAGSGTSSPGVEPAAPSPEAASLKAALLGTDRRRAEAPETPAPERKSAAVAERRRPVKKARPTEDDAPLAEDDAPEGSLSDGAFQSAITEWTGMKRCLEGNAGRLPTSSGALRVAFTIRGDGQVVKSRVVETSNDVARAIAPCVEDRARRIRFPAFAQSAQEVEKTAKFVF